MRVQRRIRYGTRTTEGTDQRKTGDFIPHKIVETNEVRVTEMHEMIEPEQQLGDYRSTRVSVLSTAHGEKMQWCGGRRWGGKQGKSHHCRQLLIVNNTAS